MKSQKIAYICNYLGPYSGSGNSGIDVLNALSAIGCKVYVFVPQFKWSIRERLHSTTNIVWVRVPSLSYNRNNLTNFKKRIKALMVAIFNLTCIKYYFIKNTKFKKTFINSFGSSFYFSKLKLKYSGQIMLVVRGSLTQISNPDYSKIVDLKFCIATLNAADQRIFVSSRTMDEWTSQLAINNKLNIYIPNCIADDKVKQVLTETKKSIKKKIFNNNSFNIICVANIQFMKGQDLIFDIYLELNRLIPDLKIFLIGGYKNPNDEFSKKIKFLLSTTDFPKINYLGPKENALQFIYASDCLILPSRGEAMPRVILEAMALKTPIVASAVDGIPELIKDGITGYTFDIDNINDMIKGIENIYLGKTKGLVDKAYQKYWDEYSFSRLKKQYSELITN